MSQRNRTKTEEVTSTPKKTSGSKGASKKAYHAQGKAILERNKLRRAKRVHRRAAYWESAEGQARKFAKMNTPAKLEKRNLWVLARNARRLARKNDAKAA